MASLALFILAIIKFLQIEVISVCIPYTLADYPCELCTTKKIKQTELTVQEVTTGYGYIQFDQTGVTPEEEQRTQCNGTATQR